MEQNNSGQNITEQDIASKAAEINHKLDIANKHLRGIDRYFTLNTRSLFRNFTFGLFSALGATVGLAIALGILSFIVKSLGGVPGMGHWFIHLGSYLSTK